MKKQIIILITISQLISMTVFCQQKDYSLDEGKVPIIGERIVLKVDALNKTKAPRGGVTLAALGGLVADHGLNFVKSELKKNIQKYMGEYSATAILDDNASIPALVLSRNILLKKTESLAKASEFHFVPIPSKDGKSFYFEILVKSLVYTKAKLKADYNYIDLAFDIEITYLDDKGKKGTVKSKPAYYSLFDLNNVLPTVKVYSDKFPLNKVSEISIKITESNPYKVKLEAIQTFLESNSDILSDVINKLKDK